MSYKRQKPIEHIDEADIDAMLKQMPDTATGTRNRALVHLLWKSGLRISEALALHTRDIDRGPDDVTRLNVRHGKGDKQRHVILFNGAIDYLDAWLETRARLGATDNDPIFCGTHSDAIGRPMQPAGVQSMLRTYAKHAGIRKRVHPHAFRHTHAKELFRRKAGLDMIQKQLGHTEPLTTQMYLQTIGCDDAMERLAKLKW